MQIRRFVFLVGSRGPHMHMHMANVNAKFLPVTTFGLICPGEHLVLHSHNTLGF